MWLKERMGWMIFALFLIVSSALVSLASVCELRQCESDMKQQVRDDCTAKGLRVNDRCCYDSETDVANATVVTVIDLHNCSLHTIAGLFKGMASLRNISLDDNPLTDIQAMDFYELPELEYLWLPSKNVSAECPGGVDAWEKSENVSGVLFCQKPVDPCSENNETCPYPQSYCKPAGPGLVDCLCSPGFHGYKCLRQGTFPTAAFCGSLIGGTVVLSAVLHFLRRKGIKSHSS